MSVKRFNINQTRPYTLKEDKGPDKTIFHLGVVDAALHAYLWDENTYVKDLGDAGNNVAPSVQVKTFTKILDTVRFGLKSWENLQDEKGSVVEFDPKVHIKTYGSPVPQFGGKPREGLTPIALDMLKPHLTELAAAIEAENNLSEQDEKNSDTPSQQS